MFKKYIIKNMAFLIFISHILFFNPIKGDNDKKLIQQISRYLKRHWKNFCLFSLGVCIAVLGTKYYRKKFSNKNNKEILTKINIEQENLEKIGTNELNPEKNSRETDEIFSIEELLKKLDFNSTQEEDNEKKINNNKDFCIKAESKIKKDNFFQEDFNAFL